MEKKKFSGDFEIAPLRGLDDFILGSARFQIPDMKNLDKWGNRVVNNLLYYQTNYILLAVAIFTLVGLLHPGKMICGLLAMGVIFGLFYYLTQENQNAFKRRHPILGLALMLLGGYFVLYVLDSFLVFLLGILLPFAATFIHSSLRLRNIKNKFVNKMEAIGLQKQTPMSLFLGGIGIEIEILS
ncbi:PRA1 family protein 3 [Chrysoperla carnea]|uniref:PRA1 family protein 3 n=1 Tax=Chrysoperla carnea TaxID=189513 RepID=UPI001D08DB24|nr:PRA1 family protein 3 [Chrysoperla carnea]